MTEKQIEQLRTVINDLSLVLPPDGEILTILKTEEAKIEDAGLNFLSVWIGISIGYAAWGKPRG